MPYLSPTLPILTQLIIRHLHNFGIHLDKVPQAPALSIQALLSHSSHRLNHCAEGAGNLLPNEPVQRLLLSREAVLC